MGNGASALSDSERNDFKKMYNIGEDKLKLIMKSFKKQAKNDRISREKFVEIMATHGVMDAELSTQVFDSFDRDHSNTMDVREYMALMGVTFGGSMDQKLKASFEIFDRNGDGSLSKDEVRQMLTMVVRQVTRAQLKANKTHTKSVSGSTPIEIDEAAAAKIEEILNQIFEKIDTDKSGSIDVNEFCTGFSEHPDICGFFKQF